MGKRGPTPWKPTREQRAKVQVWVASSIPVETIAELIGVSHMTLRKGCSEELSKGRLLELAANRLRLVKAADAGNVSAMKFLDEKIRAGIAEASFIEPEPNAIVRSTDKRVGKKEEQRDAAIRAMEGGDDSWGADLSPELPN